MKQIIIVLFITGLFLFSADRILSRPDLVISGIVKGKEPMAVINNEVVREGDTVNGVMVLEIHEDSVKFK